MYIHTASAESPRTPAPVLCHKAARIIRQAAGYEAREELVVEFKNG